MYLFSFFRNNGQDGVYLAASRAGLVWSALHGDKPLLAPQVGELLGDSPPVKKGGI